ncbi:hypothetical protein [Paraburkholderia sp.]|uniref:hypothetical protein n=1 Tax=Paraburkholderia sp. TaxID=1926495 RepID=UPI0023A19FA4|nr:hypothetical protein [Paraburkholderia sp.]MDE1180755.1 hypothetical protein [Paraburkholderia sp.]
MKKPQPVSLMYRLFKVPRSMFYAGAGRAALPPALVRAAPDIDDFYHYRRIYSAVGNQPPARRETSRF